MTYYRIIEYDPVDWIDTYILINRLKAIHYSTVFLSGTAMRNFVADFTEEDLVMAKLTLRPNVSIDPMGMDIITMLRQQGYIDK
jgi:hypothetical protein